MACHRLWCCTEAECSKLINIPIVVATMRGLYHCVRTLLTAFFVLFSLHCDSVNTLAKETEQGRTEKKKKRICTVVLFGIIALSSANLNTLSLFNLMGKLKKWIDKSLKLNAGDSYAIMWRHMLVHESNMWITLFWYDDRIKTPKPKLIGNYAC